MNTHFCPHCMEAVEPGVRICPHCSRNVDHQGEEYQLPVGTVITTEAGRRYLFGAVIGAGGFGITYIAREIASGQKVAIKEYYPFRCQPQRQSTGTVLPLERNTSIYRSGLHSFLSEASMLLAVQDIPSIVRVLDYFRANNTAYMVMEYLAGTTLKEVMDMQNRFEPVSLLSRSLPLLWDLSALHEAGVIHRDIAPDNIMQMPDGSLKLLDFGCARSMEDGKSMTVVLKPGFAPVEQYMTRGQGPYTDVYALCATIYYCLSGRIPPEAPSRFRAVQMGEPDPLLPLSQQGVIISPEQDSLLLWGLAMDPKARPQTVDLLAQELERTLVSADAEDLPEAAQTPEPEAAASADEREPTSSEKPMPKPVQQSDGKLAVLLKQWWPALLLAALCIIALLFR